MTTTLNTDVKFAPEPVVLGETDGWEDYRWVMHMCKINKRFHMDITSVYIYKKNVWYKISINIFHVSICMYTQGKQI